MNKIYIISYSKHELTNCFVTYSDGVYFNDKSKAIKYLEDNGYEYICDDEYNFRNYIYAEILELERQEDAQ